jgi:hypothetical protein
MGGGEFALGLVPRQRAAPPLLEDENTHTHTHDNMLQEALQLDRCQRT